MNEAQQAALKLMENQIVSIKRYFFNTYKLLRAYAVKIVDMLL